MRFFVFVDAPYYPYVDDIVEAETLDEAKAKVAQGLRPGDETTIYLAPVDAVSSLRMEGPKPAPQGMLALMQQQNRYTADVLAAKHGAFRVEAGSMLV